MYDNVYFYCHFGAGDVFESREFVKAWMKLVPARKYFYAHGKHPSILADIPELNYCEVTPLMGGMNDVYTVGNDLYVNTWIGRDGSYVLPGIGCVVEQHYRMHNNLLSKVTDKRLPGEPYQYLPTLDYSYYKTDTIDKFVKDYGDADKILISNGPVQSCQADNFDFTPAIQILADKYPNKLFIATQFISELTLDNLFYTNLLIEKQGFDLNEISYLSSFCNKIVGRSSGPFTFASTLQNWNDPNKTFISFTYTWWGSSFAVNQPTQAKKLWTSETSIESIVDVISKGIE